jgi:fucose permease
MGMYFYGYVCLGFFIGVLGPTLPGIADMLHVQPESLNFFFFFRGAGFIGGSLLSGILLDYVPGNFVLAGAYILMLIGSFAIPLTVNVSMYLTATVFALVGVSGAAVDVSENTLVGWMWGDRVGPYLQILHFSFGVGATIMPLLVAKVIEVTGGIHWSYWIVCVAMIPPIIIFWLLASPQKPDSSPETSTTVSSEADAKPAEEMRPVRSRCAAVRDVLFGSNRNARAVPLSLLAGITAFMLLYVGCESSVAGWLASYATERGLATHVEAAYMTAVFWGSLTLGRLAGAPLSMKLHPMVMLGVDLGGVCVSALLMILLSSYSIALWLLIGTMGFSFGSVFATLFSYPSWLGLVVSSRDSMWIMIGVSVGDMTLPLLLGWLFQALGYLAWPYCLLALGVLMSGLLALIAYLAPRRLVSASGETLVELGLVAAAHAEETVKATDTDGSSEGLAEAA